LRAAAAGLGALLAVVHVVFAHSSPQVSQTCAHSRHTAGTKSLPPDM